MLIHIHERSLKAVIKRKYGLFIMPRSYGFKSAYEEEGVGLSLKRSTIYYIITKIFSYQINKNKKMIHKDLGFEFLIIYYIVIKVISYQKQKKNRKDG